MFRGQIITQTPCQFSKGIYKGTVDLQIEHEFHQLKRRVKTETPRNKQQLELAALKAGKNLSKYETKSLVMSTGHRFTAVIMRKGSATK